MRKIIVIEMITLDGIMQAPGGSTEDSSEGFNFGGWTAPYQDEVGSALVQKELGQKTDYLLGRKTFDIWEAYWPHHKDFWPNISSGTKYVLSKRRKSSDWENTVFIETVEDIQKLKSSDGPDIQVWGSSKLVQLLLANDLVDELRLKVHPVILGLGKRLFADGAVPGAYTLTESVTTPSGVVITTYKRDGEVKTGDIEV